MGVLSDTVSGTFWRTISDAKRVEAETRMQAEDLAKAEASVFIISISTKTIVGLPPLLGNKNLSPPSIFFLRERRCLRKRNGTRPHPGKNTLEPNKPSAGFLRKSRSIGDGNRAARAQR